MGREAQDAELLRKLVRAHRVVFEVRAAEEMVGEERRKVGFDVTLSGTDGADDAIALADDREGEGVWRDLQRIALAILPPPGSPSVLGLQAFDKAVHSSPSRGNRDDVELVIGIRHAAGYLEPIDPAEEQSLKGVIAALKELGVPEGKWKEPKPPLG